MTKDNSTGKSKDFYNRGQQMFDRLNLSDDDDDDTQVYTSDVALREALAQPEQVDCPRCGHVCSQRTEQEPVAYYHPHKGFYWAKPTSIFAPTVVDVEPMPLYVKWKAAQRPWQGLTDDDWDKVGDMPDTFDQGAAWAAARLKERNT